MGPIATADFRAERLWWLAAMIFIALLVVTATIALFDRRELDGAAVWAKPMKFQASLALHFATLALALGALGETHRASRVMLIVAVASVASAAFEIVYIMIQAARQERSHFNVGTPFAAALYALMAAGAVVITVAAGAVGIAALVDRSGAVSPTMRVALGAGLIGGTILTTIVAFRMGSALSHHIGAEAPGAARVPVTGWSLTVGDWRPAHFFATHMMQSVPVAGLIAERLAPPAIAIAGVCVFALLWTAATLLLFRQAGAGLPLTGWPL